MIKCASYPDNIIEDTPVTSFLIAVVMIVSVVSSMPKLKFEYSCSFFNRIIQLFVSSNVYYGLVNSLGIYGTSSIEFGINDTRAYSLIVLDLVLINAAINAVMNTKCQNSSSDLTSMLSFFNTYSRLNDKIRQIIFWVSLCFFLVALMLSSNIAKLEIPSEIVRFTVDIVSAVFTSVMNNTSVTKSNTQKEQFDTQVSAALAVVKAKAENNSEI
jgi:hypothetical protein